MFVASFRLSEFANVQHPIEAESLSHAHDIATELSLDIGIDLVAVEAIEPALASFRIEPAYRSDQDRPLTTASPAA